MMEYANSCHEIENRYIAEGEFELAIDELERGMDRRIAFFGLCEYDRAYRDSWMFSTSVEVTIEWEEQIRGKQEELIPARTYSRDRQCPLGESVDRQHADRQHDSARASFIRVFKGSFIYAEAFMKV